MTATEEELRRARMEYMRTHWGRRGPVAVRRVRVPNPFVGVAVELGELVQVVYRTRKGSDLAAVEYEHDFGRPLPRLSYVEGGLIIVGGGYVVEERGIVG